MPIYMDRHDISPGTPRENVVLAHAQDVFLQSKYFCKCITYWYDEQRSSVFCLFDAPSKKAVHELHEEAHGLIPNQIIEVDKDVVEAFLGRIEDPESEDEKIETAFRVIMFTDLKDSTKITGNYGDKIAMDLIRMHNVIIRKNIKQHKGRDIKHTGDGYMISFSSVSKAVECSIAIQKAFATYNEENQVAPMHIRIGLSAGEPVTESGDLFGVTVQLASRICNYTKADKIMVTSAIREICLGSKIHFEDKGRVSLKGFETNTHVYEVNWKS